MFIDLSEELQPGLEIIDPRGERVRGRCHFEIYTHDPKAARRLYENVLG